MTFNSLFGIRSDIPDSMRMDIQTFNSLFGILRRDRILSDH